MYPRLTKSSRYDEVEAREVAFKAFKVAYDRESGYIGYKVSGAEFKVECTKFDKLLMVFKDGHYKVIELPEKLFVGPDMVYCGLPERDRVFTAAYTNRELRQPPQRGPGQAPGLNRRPRSVRRRSRTTSM